MNHNRKSPFGFTLMEMLVALVMSGAVMASLYIITRGVAEQTSAKQMEIEAMQRARTAMDILIRDFSRTGLFTSPNTAVDGRYLNRDTTSSSVQFRAALIHLNPGGTGSDSVMLVGNFLGSSVYRAYAVGNQTLTFIDPVGSAEDCARQFDPRYAFAHISGNSGRDLDAKVSAAVSAGTTCTITINGNDYNSQSFKTGDTVFAAANQTIIYTVESGTLVRYFASYTNNGAACSVSDAGSPVQILPATRQVIANFVEDFQVWFRPVSDESGWSTPHYQTSTAVSAAQSGTFADGFAPLNTTEFIPLTADGTVPSGMNCDDLDAAGDVGPQNVRSALIRLTVRTEQTTAPMGRLADTVATRLEKHNLAAASGADPYAYLLRTVTTEVDMPNLAARSDLLVP